MCRAGIDRACHIIVQRVPALARVRGGRSHQRLIMKTTKITKADIESSILSVPPLARRADHSIDREGNARILAHLRSGGVKTFMYGGNANLYNIAPSEFVTLCELLIELSQDSDWMIPSVGSDFGKAQD